MARAKKKKAWLCFSKKLLIADYVILLLLLFYFVLFTVADKDTTNWAIVLGAWIAQLGISSGAYYWKAKSENLIKMPIELLDDIPEDMRERADPSAIIESVLGMRN